MGAFVCAMIYGCFTVWRVLCFFVLRFVLKCLYVAVLWGNEPPVARPPVLDVSVCIVTIWPAQMPMELDAAL